MVVFGRVSDARLSQETAAKGTGELNATSRIAAMALGPDKQISFLARKWFSLYAVLQRRKEKTRPALLSYAKNPRSMGDVESSRQIV